MRPNFPFFRLLPFFLLIIHSFAGDLTQKQADSALKAAYQKALEQGSLMNIAVVDAGANLKAFVRMDGSYLGSIDVAIKKAKTARFFNCPTGELGEITQPGQAIYNIEHSNGGLITFPGGVPLRNADGDIIGAIGVSGGSIEQDHEAAMAAAELIANATNGGEPMALKHVVCVKFKDDAPQSVIDEIVAIVLDFPNTIPQVLSVEGGQNVSTEGNDKGFTHSFVMTFRDMDALHQYLPHEVHVAMVEQLKPVMEDVLVMDYWSE